MYGFISGISDTGDIRYCPKCGNDEGMTYFYNGTAKCWACGFRFGVIEVEEEDE